MSKSRCTSYRNAVKSTTHAAAPAARKRPRRRASRRPGINIKPALAALRDLAAWALGLAERDVAAWPEGRRRVRVSRRYLLARLRGERPQRVPVADALFTITLLARIFETELGLPMTELLAVFDQLEITSKNVPSCALPSSAAGQIQAPVSAASVPTAPQMAPVTPLPSRHAPVKPVRGPACDRSARLRFRVAA